MAARQAPDRRLFDLWSRVYDAPWVQRITYRPPQDAVLRELARRPAGRVLDLGCGTGLLVRRIRREGRARTCVGCDFSPGMLREARRNAPGLPTVCGDATRLPFHDACFDAAVSTEAFHWFPDPDLALAELARVLAPDGRLLLAMINPDLEWISTATRLGSRLLGEPLCWPTRARLRDQMEAAGLVVERQERVFRLSAPLLLPCVLTVARRTGPEAG